MLKEGKDVTIVSVGQMSYVALAVAGFLSGEGIDCEVINARFIKPLDFELIAESLLKTGKLFTIEEGVVNGGFGEFLLESIVNKAPRPVFIKNIGLPDRFIEHGDRALLLDRYGLSSQKIKEEVLRCLKQK